MKPLNPAWADLPRRSSLGVDTVNRRGGDATLVHLLERGVTGNTHFLMSDLNNVEIADPIAEWLAGKTLD